MTEDEARRVLTEMFRVQIAVRLRYKDTDASLMASTFDDTPNALREHALRLTEDMLHKLLVQVHADQVKGVPDE